MPAWKGCGILEVSHIPIYQALVYNFRMRSPQVGVRLLTLLVAAFLVNSCSGSIEMEQADITTTDVVKTPIPKFTPTQVKPTLTTMAIVEGPTPTPEAADFPQSWIFPDWDIVYSPSCVDFNIDDYLGSTSGYLAEYDQFLMITGHTSGADIVKMVALENSINPKLLLALVEYQSGQVLSIDPESDACFPALGNLDYYRQDLYGQLVWAVHIISEGFYGWLNGTIQEITFQDGEVFTPDLEVNSGTFGLQYFFAQFHSGKEWENDLDQENGFPALYAEMFGDPWANVAVEVPLLPKDLEQPGLGLPFEAGVTWAFTGGPHYAFEGNGPPAALDFSPPMAETGCHPSNEWVTAAANGLIVRSELGQVVQDLDGDGLEQTGWSILYLHISEADRVPEGTYLRAGEFVGHPSCDGGRATGTHLHLARKYNGVWIAAAGEIPFVLDRWRTAAGEEPYLGQLIRDGQVITANQFGAVSSFIQCDPISIPTIRIKVK